MTDVPPAVPVLGLDPLSVLSAALESPNAPALWFQGECWTWQEVADRVRPLVADLRAELHSGNHLNPDPSTCPIVAIATPTRETILLVLAALECGRPLALIHPRLTPNEQRHLEQRIRRSFLCSTEHGIGCVDTSEAGVASSDALATIVFTSGSTGKAKGVGITRRALIESANASAERLGWVQGDRWLVCMPLSHIGGLSIVVRCLMARQCIVLLDGLQVTPDALINIVEMARVSLLSLVPTQLHRLLQFSPRWSPPSHLRLILLGGAGASRALLLQAWSRNFPVLTTYGMTEAASQITTMEPAQLPELFRHSMRYAQKQEDKLQFDSEWLDAFPGAGKPLLGASVRTEEGQIWVRGKTLAKGYLPDSPGEPWSPLTDDSGWFNTGDLGYLDTTGNLHVEGRRVDRIVTGGENVAPMEVEQALEALPQISEACVFGEEDPEWGEHVAAAVVFCVEIAADEVKAALRQSLASYKHPRVYYRVDALVYNATGKLDRKATCQKALSSGIRVSTSAR